MKKVSVVLLTLLVLALPAFAQKIGYVDLQRALNNSAAGAAAKQLMSEQVKQYEAEFTQKQDEVMRMKTDLEKQAALLSDTARAEREREYQKRVTDLQRFQKDIQEELQIKDSEYTSRIINELFDVLQQIGKEQGYAMVIEKNEGAVIFADPSVDLTDDLIKAYDALQ